jgi:hypothetical protein
MDEKTIPFITPMPSIFEFRCGEHNALIALKGLHQKIKSLLIHSVPVRHYRPPSNIPTYEIEKSFSLKCPRLKAQRQRRTDTQQFALPRHVPATHQPVDC